MPTNPLQRNHVTVCGNPQAPGTLVFIHGFGTDQTAWHPVSQAFAADFRIVLLDLVGAGKSDPEAFRQHRYLNLDQYATDLLEVCDALQLSKAILVGHSSGAMVAALAAVRAPGRFARLVMIGASPRYVDEEGYRGGFNMEQIDALYKRILQPEPGWADGFAPAMMGNADRPELGARFAKDLNAIPRDRVLTVVCSILQSDHREQVRRLALPTLLVHTTRDQAVPMEVAHYLHGVIQGSELVVIDGDGHLPHISAPAQVVQAIGAFLRAADPDLR